MLSCALTRLPSCSLICSVVDGCAVSTSGASAAVGALSAVVTALSATADDLYERKSRRCRENTAGAVESAACVEIAKFSLGEYMEASWCVITRNMRSSAEEDKIWSTRGLKNVRGFCFF